MMQPTNRKPIALRQAVSDGLRQAGAAGRRAAVAWCPVAVSAEDAGVIRLRPILMTAIAFILGVMPMLGAHGAGAALNRPKAQRA